jgi:site-specific DNA recombinase
LTEVLSGYTKELFYRVQEEKARRGNIYRAAIKKKRGEEKSKYSGKYALSGLMICAECGQPYRRQVWSKYGKKSAVWRCDNRLKHGSERCKNSPTLKEEILHEAIMMAIGKVVEDQGEFVQAFRENVIRIIGSYGNKAKPTEYNTEIQELEKHLMSLIEESAKGNCGEEDFDREYRRVTAHLKELRKRKEQSRKEQRLAEAYDQRAGEVDDYIRKAGVLSREFDNDLVWRLIQTVKVINQNKIELQFRSGIVMVQRLDKWEN